MEAKFLRRRQERLEERIKAKQELEEKLGGNDDDNNNDETNLQWQQEKEGLQQAMNTWKGKLKQDFGVLVATHRTLYSSSSEPTSSWSPFLFDDIVETSATTKPEPPPLLNEDDKRDIRMKLVQFQQDLHQLRNQGLSSSSMTTTTVFNDTVEFRWMHDQFLECQHLLDKVKQVLLPKGKFVFARYRLAMQQEEEKQQQQQQEEKEGDSFDTDKTNNSNNVNESKAKDDENNRHGRLKDLDSKYIRIYPTHVELRDLSLSSASSSSQGTDGPAMTSLPLTQPISLLSDLKHCLVEMMFPSGEADTEILLSNLFVVQSEHVMIRFVPESITTTTTRISGTTVLAKAIHVTDCSQVTFQGWRRRTARDANHHDSDSDSASDRLTHVQQVRLHNSSFLTFADLHVTAGAILEGCTSIVFQHPSAAALSKQSNLKQPQSLQVRDFDWLKPGIPSPNFEIAPPSTSMTVNNPTWLPLQLLQQLEQELEEQQVPAIQPEKLVTSPSQEQPLGTAQTRPAIETEATNTATLPVSADEDDSDDDEL